jgi:hypothetical protein
MLIVLRFSKGNNTQTVLKDFFITENNIFNCNLISDQFLFKYLCLFDLFKCFCSLIHHTSKVNWTLWHVTQFKWPISDKPLDIVACDTIQVTNQWQAIGHCGMWHNSSDQSVTSHWTLWHVTQFKWPISDKPLDIVAMWQFKWPISDKPLDIVAMWQFKWPISDKPLDIVAMWQFKWPISD